jgi:hypothetical protein
MRLGRATPLALLLASGCVWPGVGRPDGPNTSLKPAVGPTGPDAVGLQLAVLEVPVGDRYVNGGLWTTADEQAVSLDHKAVLDDNGLRVGLIGGMRPAEFDDLLNSPRSNPNSRWVQMRAGHARVIPLGGVRPTCQFRLAGDGAPTIVEQAQCAVQITPTVAADGGVTLTFVPLVRRSDRPVWAAPTDDDLPGGSAAGDQFPALGWEVTVSARELVIVGTQFERLDTLGRALFVDPDGARPVQRLLVIQAVRPASAESRATEDRATVASGQ